jgi:hypothetical protein
LVPGIVNTKAIKVSGISQSVVASNTNGNYTGTITVNISNLN